VFNGLRYIVKMGAPWSWMPHDLPPWAAEYQQTQRWLAAGCFEALVNDLRAVLRLAAGAAGDRGEVERLARIVQAVTGDTVEIAYVDQGYTGARGADTAASHGIALEVMRPACGARPYMRRWPACRLGSGSA